MKKRYVILLIVITVLGLGCALGISMPGTSDCIRTCNTTNAVCLDQEHKCNTGDTCFNNLETCFDDANQCNHDCDGCEEANTCVEEDKCRDKCGDKANECTDMIKTCIDAQEACLKQEVKHKEACLNGPDGFAECVAVCIEQVEEKIKEL
jgi:hypothetical protein